MGMTKIVGWVCSIFLLSIPAVAQMNNVSASDRTFLKMAADANMKEAHLGQMAEQQASESDVRDFGQKLTHDHSDAYGELLALAQKTGEAIPRGIDIKNDSAIERLQQLKGDRFDRQFVQHEIQDHRKTIAEFKREAKDGHDADIKAYANKVLPVLEDHLQAAEKLAKSEKHT